MAGGLFLVTFAASIPAAFVFYAPALGDPAYVLGSGADRNVAIGALLEMVLIAANVGTALALHPLLRRWSEPLSLGYVAARLVECGFIATGLLAMLALASLRARGDAPDEAMLAVGQALTALHDWTFRLGPGFVVGIGNGLILGWLMWTSGLVPRWLSILGLIGGPGILVSGTAVLLGLIEAGGGLQILATVPEFFWELGLGLWLTLRGTRPGQSGEAPVPAR